MSNPYQQQIEELKKKIATNQALLSDPELSALAQQEINQQRRQLQQLQELARQFQTPQQSGGRTKTDMFINCTLEIRPGAGGDEAKIWAHDLKRMYLRFIENTSLKVAFLDDLVFKISGRLKQPRQIFSVADPNIIPPATAYEIFQYESGVHRVQRIPTTESQGRIHTSTASVAVLPEVAKTAVKIKNEDLEWQFYRSGGAGGQNVNKVNTAVRLTHLPSQIVVTCSSERTQTRNREIALELLRAKLWEIQEEKRLQQIGQARSAIGRAMRAEKIRTFNYPQNRVTDHRINTSWHNLDKIIDGDLGTIILALWQKLKPTQDGSAAKK